MHAGEAAGADSIWQAIRELGAERIGHGVKAVEDPALMDFLAEHRIGIESCLTSNIQTSTVAHLSHHPLVTFLDHGILATLNTDDPAVQGMRSVTSTGGRAAGGPVRCAYSPGAGERPDHRLPERRRETAHPSARGGPGLKRPARRVIRRVRAAGQ